MKTTNNPDLDQLNELLKGSPNPFQVPSGYFETFPSVILKQVESVPDFALPVKENPFTVPVGYFEKLPLEISNRIAVSGKPVSPSWLANILRQRIAIPLAFATVVVLSLLFLYTQKNINLTSDREFTFEDFNNSGIVQTIDEDMLVEMIETRNLNNNDDSLIQYLIDNDIDISQIEKAL